MVRAGGSRRQIGAMSDQVSPGEYRVRPAVQNERSVPANLPGPRFPSLVEAESYARTLCRVQHRPMVVEKLARAGCWLQVGAIGPGP